jgi:hypothetical protein
MARANVSSGYAERLRAHCSVTDLARWKEAAERAGARNLSEWVRWVLDKEAALVGAASRNSWLEPARGRRRPQVVLSRGRRKTVLRWPELADLKEESEGL